MKNLELELSKNELKGLYNLTKMYVAGFQAANNEVAYLHSVMLLEYLDYLKEELIYAKQQNNIVKLDVKYMPLFFTCGYRFFNSLPPFEASLSSHLNNIIVNAINQDKAAIRAFEQQFNNNLIQ